MRRARWRGLVLGVVLIFIPLLVVMTMAMSSLGVSQLWSQRALHSRQAATEASLAGLARATDQLGQDNNWVAGFSDEPLSDDPPTAYSVTVVNNLRGTTDQMSGITVVPPGFAYLISRGTWRGGYVQTLTSMIELAPPADPPALPEANRAVEVRGWSY